MSPLLIKIVISLGGGIFCLLLGYGVIPACKDADESRVWARKFGPMMKILGVLFILFGLLKVFGITG